MRTYKEYKIRNLSRDDFLERIAENPTVIVPTGAVEIYGPHLPMGADGIVTDFLAEVLAPKMNALIAPKIDLADSSMLLDLPGTISISKELFTRWIDELMESLISYGAKNFLFLTGHAASVDSINYIARKYQLKNSIRYAQIDWWRFAGEHGDEIFEEKGRMAHGHASECGTSVLLYIAPELVNMDKASRIEPDEKLYTYPDIIRFTPINLKSCNSTVGDATKGNAQKGEQIVNKCVNRICDFLQDEWELELKRD